MEVKTNLTKVKMYNNDKTLSLAKMGIHKIKDRIWDRIKIDKTKIKAIQWRKTHNFFKIHIRNIKIKEVIDKTFKWIKVKTTIKVNATQDKGSVRIHIWLKIQDTVVILVSKINPSKVLI